MKDTTGSSFHKYYYIIILDHKKMEPEMTLGYLWRASDLEVQSMLRRGHQRNGLEDDRINVVKLYQDKLTAEERKLTQHPDFEKLLLTDDYQSALYKMNYTSLERIWDLKYNEVKKLVEYLEPSALLTPQQIGDYKLLLAKTYQKEGRLIDSHLLTLPQSSSTLLRYGYQALKDRYQVRDSLAPYLDELGLASLVSEYAVDDLHVYLALTRGLITVVNVRTHKFVREIECPYRSITIIGRYKDTLYIKGDGDIWSVSLSPSTDFECLKEDVYQVHLYKNLLCYMEQENSQWTVIDLDTPNRQVVRILGLGNNVTTFYECRDKYIFEIAQYNICYDLTTGQSYDVFGYRAVETFIGVFNEDVLLFSAFLNTVGASYPFLMSYNTKTGKMVTGQALTYMIDNTSPVSSLVFNGQLILSYLGQNVIQAFDPETLLEVGDPLYQFQGIIKNLYVDQEQHQLIFTEEETRWSDKVSLVFMSLDDFKLTTFTYDKDEFNVSLILS
jgi:hypothetical protein